MEHRMEWDVGGVGRRNNVISKLYSAVLIDDDYNTYCYITHHRTMHKS